VSTQLNGAGTIIAVDAMGGDHAPDEIIKGAVEARRRGVNVVLVGSADAIQPKLEEHHGIGIETVEANDSITMSEPVSQALRRRDSSLRVAVNLVTTGDAHAVVSCGNSAAIMAMGLTVWGPLPGIDRPAFGSMLPCKNGEVFILDIGANTSVKAEHLVQFAVMGEVFVQLSRGIEAPRIALLSNGSEDSKGTKEVKEANEALRKLPLNFIGNIEGDSVFDGVADVVVCDGFTGNVLLKAGEGVVSTMFDLIRTEVSKDFVARIAAALMLPTLGRIRRRVDYEEYGGAPVLGVNKVMINCHGRSHAKAVTNAVLLADRMAREGLVDRIGEALQHDDIEVKRRRRLTRALHLRAPSA
jgi:glycerol-3-phosphate acyltransferase PlsX